VQRAVICSVLFLFATSGSFAQRSSSLSQQTANNTSACAAAGSPSYCQAGWAGMSDAASGIYDPVPGNVSSVNAHGGFPGGKSSRIMAQFQPWFCMNPGSTQTGAGTLCGNHIQVGYNSNDSSTINGQMEDMLRRGLDGVIVDWYGSTSTFDTFDQVTQKIRDNLNPRCSGPQNCPLYLALLEDDGSFKWTQCPQNNGQDQTACITSALENDLDSMNTNYFGASGYLKVDSNNQISSSGRPVVEFFVCESCWSNPSPNWAQIWNDLRSHVQNYSNGNPIFLFENAGGFTHGNTDGGFAWVNWYGSNDPYGLIYLDNFYDTAKLYPGLLPFGAAWKGFDNSNAPWLVGPPTITGQQCGRTLSQTLQQISHNGDYGSTHPLPFMQVVTWNDYEEGTEVETGVDNCLTLTASISGTIMSWTPTFTGNGSESTVAQYTVFASTNNSNLTPIGNYPPGTRSLDLSKFNFKRGTYTIYVKAIGVPFILNHMSGGVQYKK
jgi:hypothetical protein